MSPTDQVEQIFNVYKNKWVEIEYTVEKGTHVDFDGEVNFEIIRKIDGKDVMTF